MATQSVQNEVMAIAVGTKAPNFTLKSFTGEALVDVTLADHAGKDNVVLLFVPGAFTGVCTKELCNVSEGLHPLPNSVVYGISVDSAFAQHGWAVASHIKTTLISDFKHEVTQGYDVVLPDLAGLGPASKRAVFVIGKDGMVKYAEVTPTPLDMPDFVAVKGALDALGAGLADG